MQMAAACTAACTAAGYRSCDSPRRAHHISVAYCSLARAGHQRIIHRVHRHQARTRTPAWCSVGVCLNDLGAAHACSYRSVQANQRERRDISSVRSRAGAACPLVPPWLPHPCPGQAAGGERGQLASEGTVTAAAAAAASSGSPPISTLPRRQRGGCAATADASCCTPQHPPALLLLRTPAAPRCGRGTAPAGQAISQHALTPAAGPVVSWIVACELGARQRVEA